MRSPPGAWSSTRPDQVTGPGPDVAGAVFGERLPTAITYAELLAGPGVDRGLLGPREVPRMWERHLLNCAAVAPELSAGARVADLGSGAGLPGVVVAILRPDVHVALVEPLLRRTTFLLETVAALDLRNAEVVRARAEQLAGRRSFDVVLARAVASLDRLAGWALPLLRPGGRLLALKGAGADDETEAASGTLAALGAARWAVRRLEMPGATPPVTVVEVVAGAALPVPGGRARRVSRETARGPARG